MRHLRRLLIAAAALALVPTCAASAQAPSNDSPGDAREITLPTTVAGTTVDATASKDNEPPSTCAGVIGPSVYFSVKPRQSGRIVANLKANGNLDATVDVLRLVRSDRRPVTCDATADNGEGGVDFQARRNATYLIRVAERRLSKSGTFSLQVFAPQPSPRPPGTQLRSRGTTRTVDRLQNPSDAFSKKLLAGVPYRIAVSGRGGGRCSLRMTIYAPGTRSFNDRSFDSARCGEYLNFTPRRGEGGRYSFVVRADRGKRTAQGYHLEVAKAGRDDLAPGRFLRNYARIKARIQPSRIDHLDLYRFDVERRSRLDLTLRGRGDVDLALTNDKGSRIRSSNSSGGSEKIRVTLKPGRYYATVQGFGNSASGTYTLRRVSRGVTQARVGVPALTAPGRRVPIVVRVPGAQRGGLRVVIDRFDPNFGFRFYRTIKTALRGPRRVISFRPPAVGRYRVQAFYLGDRRSATSTSKFTRFLVAGPLRQ